MINYSICINWNENRGQRIFYVRWPLLVLQLHHWCYSRDILDGWLQNYEIMQSVLVKFRSHLDNVVKYSLHLLQSLLGEGTRPWCPLFRVVRTLSMYWRFKEVRVSWTHFMIFRYFYFFTFPVTNFLCKSKTNLLCKLTANSYQFSIRSFSFIIASASFSFIKK